ncbi:hypothetical protein Cgig2_033159 [Carnegiea gigantea]|uniref:Uncharacterized protein n=1 Tax=Carnegiea gigantea TaxID=171969 RepID=A0A9Q1JM73_9CARY|nr:hypothetical protein Cgig2_033159 [Carnegiea gigantea]
MSEMLLTVIDKSSESELTYITFPASSLLNMMLVETEKIILKLVDYGGKLIKKIEKSPSFDAASTTGGSGRGRRCSEQARRMSEKKAEEVHFALMKLDNSKWARVRPRHRVEHLDRPLGLPLWSEDLDPSSLDLSMNMLSRTIPPDLTQLVSLEVFNVPHNLLVAPYGRGNSSTHLRSVLFMGTYNYVSAEYGYGAVSSNKEDGSDLIGWIIGSLGYISGFAVNCAIGQYMTDWKHEWFVEMFRRRRWSRRTVRTSTQSWIPIERAVIKSVKLASLWNGAYQKIVGHIKDLKKWNVTAKTVVTEVQPSEPREMSKSSNGRGNFPKKCGRGHIYFSEAAIWLELRQETFEGII